MSGNIVRCPRCKKRFVFEDTKNNSSAPSTVTDTGVVRILGDIPKPAVAPVEQNQPENRSVSDTGVMRILGDMESIPPAPEKKMSSWKACPRCEMSISNDATVCVHCNCYVGVMPHFMQQMVPNTVNSPKS